MDFSMLSISDIVEQLDGLAGQYEIGGLQEHRRKIKRLSWLPTKLLFNGANNENWAHHSGGRVELQFNIGYEGAEKKYFDTG
jgi:hypothetical protein